MYPFAAAAAAIGLVACSEGAVDERDPGAAFEQGTGGTVADGEEGEERERPGEVPDTSDPDADADAGDAGSDADAAGPLLPKSKRFDLTQPSYDLFRNKPLHESGRVMQSFAFDNKNHRLFFAQLQNGTPGDDLCISELDFSGKLLGHMHLNGAGHGVSICVEPVGKDTYLWVETDSNEHTDAGRGTALLRFKFESGKKPTGKKFLTGSTAITCATDPVNERIAIRRKENGKMHFSVFDLASASKGDFSTPLAYFPMPSVSKTSVVFQGYTIYGQYLYTLDGTGHGNMADINSYINAIDMHTGKLVSRERTLAGKTLVYREPEGMAIYRTTSGETRLYFGFGSRDTLNGKKRFANAFYKNVLID